MIHEYLHLLSDPAHLLVELTFILVVDVILMGLIWPFFKRYHRDHDKKVHGVWRSF